MNQLVADRRLDGAGVLGGGVPDPSDISDIGDASVDAVAMATMLTHARCGMVPETPGSVPGSVPDSGSAEVEESLGLLRLADRLVSWTAAQRARLVSRVHERFAADAVERDGVAGRSGGLSAGQDSLVFAETVTEIGCLLSLSEAAAGRMVTESLELTGSLPGTLLALESGRICPVRASVIIDHALTLPEDARAGFEQAVLPGAGDLNRPRLNQRCRRIRERLHPESIRTRAIRSRAQRCLNVQPALDGMAWLTAFLPAEQAYGFYAQVDATARGLRAADESRTLAQLRADVFTDAFAGTVAASGPGGGKSTAARILVTVPVLSLLGLSEEPGELEGYGPISASAARDLAAHAPSFTRLLTHPHTGAVLGVDRTRYAVPADLKTWLQVRDRTCRFPGCNRAASRSDVDHSLPWAVGGITSHENLAHLCRRHHTLKHESRWTVQQNAPGVLTWTSPAGKTYTTRPEPLYTPGSPAPRDSPGSPAPGAGPASPVASSNSAPDAPVGRPTDQPPPF